ncbi:hypothetical protein chiPu_0031600, partial [Chiloscyllium punctatum]|nr:hypothetical protein [Chiloscyllium punctatum]
MCRHLRGPHRSYDDLMNDLAQGYPARACLECATMKATIVRELGQPDILLPSLVAEGLAANDRIKLRLSALQAAVQHARAPHRAVADLTIESRAAGLAPAMLATLIGGAHLAGGSKIVAPGLAPLLKSIEGDAETMIRAVTAG